jgi:hypothetical protein
VELVVFSDRDIESKREEVAAALAAGAFTRPPFSST